jgi:polyhydroxyalkanoate synthesis regulator phasin
LDKKPSEVDTLKAYIAVELAQMQSQIQQLENVVITILRIGDLNAEETEELVCELLNVERNNHYRDVIQIKINDKVKQGGPTCERNG